MSLEDRSGSFMSKLLKGIVFFAILGCIVLTVAVTMIGNVMKDITNPNPGGQTTTTTTTSTSASPAH